MVEGNGARAMETGSERTIDPQQRQRWQVPNFERYDFFERRTRYALIIPVLNEGERIRRQLQRMAPFFPLADSYIVDGGSSDGAVTPAHLAPSGLRGLLIKTGPGKLSAQLRVGLAHVLDQGYEGVILIDGNDKDGPEAIPAFIEKLDSGFDHIQGSRFVSGGRAVNTPPSRLWGIKLVHAPMISIAARFRYTDTTNGFRAYSRRMLLDPDVQPFREVFSRYELHYYLAIRAARLGFRIVEVPVERAYPDGETPTKISGLRGNAAIFRTLFAACVGRFDPPREGI